MTCEYCKPKNVIFEDKDIKVFVDNIAENSLRVVPNKHITIIEELSDDIFSYMMNVANKFATILFEKFQAQGTNLLIQNGTSAGQEIPHVSILVIPRKQDDKLDLEWKMEPASEDLLGDMEAKLIEALNNKDKPKTPSKKEENKPEEQTNESNEELKEPEKIETDYQIKHLTKIP